MEFYVHFYSAANWRRMPDSHDMILQIIGRRRNRADLLI